jgi:hypothetical protein
MQDGKCLLARQGFKVVMSFPGSMISRRPRISSLVSPMLSFVVSYFQVFKQMGNVSACRRKHLESKRNMLTYCRRYLKNEGQEIIAEMEKREELTEKQRQLLILRDHFRESRKDQAWVTMQLLRLHLPHPRDSTGLLYIKNNPLAFIGQQITGIVSNRSLSPSTRSVL